jgi:hypothetical protein
MLTPDEACELAHEYAELCCGAAFAAQPQHCHSAKLKNS